MGTLLVGLLLVAASAAGFGLALFGRRPVPQPAMARGGAHLGDADPQPSAARPVASDPSSGEPPRSQRDRFLAALRPRRAHHSADVTLSPWVRVRSALVLALTVVGLAGIIGGALSVVVVGLVLVVT